VVNHQSSLTVWAWQSWAAGRCKVGRRELRKRWRRLCRRGGGDLAVKGAASLPRRGQMSVGWKGMGWVKFTI
jgi:hypothetical protein